MNSRRAAALALLAGASFPRIASADQLTGTRFDAEERAHTVDATIDRGFATLVVRRTVENVGPRSDQAVFRLDLPPGAVATALRTMGKDKDGAPVWFEGELMDAAKAAAEYQELTGFGEARPKDPALLSWRSASELGLQVFPVPAQGDKTVEYTLVVPMPYAEGQYVLDLPEPDRPERPTVLRVRAAHPEDVLQVNGASASKKSAETQGDVSVRLSPRGGPRVSASLAAVPLSPGRAFVHERAVAAPRLGEVPEGAAVAVVLDVSKSMEGALAAELAAARAYLSRFRAADVTVVTFDRRVTLPFGESLSAAEALARLSGFAPRLGNGSQLDDALERADAVLSRSPRTIRRIVLLTDLRAREGLTPESFADRPLRSHALVHLSTVDSGAASLARDDASPWASLPRRTGGVFWHALAEEGGPLARSVFEEWARPKRLDHLKLTGFPESGSPPETLDEGREVEFLGIAPSKPASLVVEGELWSTPVRVSATSTAEEEQRWSALVFGSDRLSDLTDDEQRALATKGRAVTPFTSYIAIEPGVRPSTEGLDLSERGVGEGGGGVGFGVGLGSIGTIGHGGSRPDPLAFLRRQLSAAWTTCGARGRGRVHLESTLAEVVGVGDVELSVPSRVVADCLREAEWALDLSGDFTGEHDAWTVELGG